VSPAADERLDAARRAHAGFHGMLASSVATGEALERLGDATLRDIFSYLSGALRLCVQLAGREVARLEGSH
jgi:hypothetical protein